MKINFHRSGFLSACSLAQGCLGGRSVNPVLQNLKVMADADRCTLMATDTEVGIRLDVRSVTTTEQGECLLPAQRTVSILREATDEELFLEADPGGSVIRGARLEYELPGEDASIYPDFPADGAENYHAIDAAVLRDLIKRVIFAPANSETNSKWGATSGILWELDDGKVRLVATDGRRLATADGPATESGEHKPAGQPIVPVKAMNLLQSNIKDTDEPVRVTFKSNEVLFRTDRATIYSRLVEGRFPDWKKAMPTNPTAVIPIVGRDFARLIRQAAVMTSEESMGVVFAFSPGKLTLQAQGSQTGKSRVEGDLESTVEQRITFDPGYILEMLKAFEPETQFSLELIKPDSPAVFRREGYAYVVLPLVTKEGAK